MERMLVAVVTGGLANRLKTIVSAHRIARETGRALYVYWQHRLWWNDDGKERHLPWPDGWEALFATPVNTIAWDDVRQLDWMPDPARQQWDYHVIPRDDSRDAIVRTGWRWMRYDDEPDVDLLTPERTSEAQRQVIAAIQPYMRVAQPVPHIQDRIDRFAAEHGIGPHWTGLHVRTQHEYCRRISLDGYEAAVNAELRARPDARFLLCSDSLEAERHLLARYQGRMIAYPKTTDDVVEGLRSGDAVVDLCLLARTGRLIGASGSTYNEFSWWLAGCAIPLTVVHPPPVAA